VSAPTETLGSHADGRPVGPAADVGRGAAARPGTDPAASFTLLSRVLRAAGSAALVAALSTFLWQHWESGGDLTRAGTLLAHTLLLAGAGLVCGLRAGDGKAARTFLGLAAASLPVVFCVAGGLVYSQLGGESARAAVPRYALWVAPSPAAALAAAAVAALCAVPVAALALGVLARRRAAVLTAAFCAANALLLVPTRDADAVAALTGLALAGAAALEWRWLRGAPGLATLEGGLARALVLAPLVLLLGRSVLHYDLSAPFHGVLGIAAAASLFAASLARRLPGSLRACARWGALAPAAWGSVALAIAALQVDLDASLGLPLAAGMFAGLLTAASLAAGEAAWGAAYRRAGGVAFAAASALGLFVAPGAAASLVAVASAIGVLAWGTLQQSRALQLAGAAGALAAGAVHVRLAVELYAWSRWGSLAALGAGVILAASAVERWGPEASARLTAWRRRVGSGSAAGSEAR